MAATYQQVSRKLGFAKEALDSIINQTGTWEGEASEAFAQRVGDLPGYLGKAAESMSRDAGALDQWSGELGEMQRRAQDLEIKARQARDAAEQARDNPAFGLANRTFHDPESLQAAREALAQAARQLTAAIDGLEAILHAADRVLQQHTELAERIAEQLRHAREIAPDEPGLLVKVFTEVGDALGDAFNDVVDAVGDVAQEIGDFVEDNAELIAEISTVLGDISTAIGVVGDYLPEPAGTIVGAVSLRLGIYALGGHLVAKAAGADVSDETITLDVAGVVTGAAGMIPVVPGGTYNAAFQVGFESAARVGGEDGGTTVGKFIPRNERQWWTAAGGVLYPPALIAPGAENIVVDGVEGVSDGYAKDNAGQAERDQQRAEKRVWES